MALPIPHLSFSALMCFMRNRYEFKRVYMDKQYRESQNPALVVGKAFHKCMEMYYKGHTKEQSLEIGFMLIHDVEHTIDFGKTGSLEKVLEDYRKTVEHYFEDGEKFIVKEHVRDSELSMKGMTELVEIPIKAVADLTLRTPDLEIVDFKKVTAFSTEKTEDGTVPPIKAEYLIQASFNYWAALGQIGEEPKRMHFLEVKTSKNKDKDEPQCQLVTIEFSSDGVKRYMNGVKALIISSLTLLKDEDLKDVLFTPNVSDMMSGQDTWNEWMATQK